MEYTFVAQPHARGVKRPKVESACEACKKRKKRCRHRTAPWQPISDLSENQERQISRSNDTQPQHDGPRDLPTLHTTDAESSISKSKRSGNRAIGLTEGPPARTRRFVGDLNPEAFLAQVGSGQPALDHDRDRVGIWVDSADEDDNSGEAEEPTPQVGLGKALRATDLRAQGETYEDVTPQKEDQNALLDIYFSSVHPILPIVDEVEFRKIYSAGKAPISLVQAMCLVSGKAERSRPYLRIRGESVALSYRTFAQRLYNSLSRHMEDGAKLDKVLLIQVCALCSLYSEGPNGLEESSMQLAKAIQYAHTIGIHLGRTQPEHQQEHLKHLFWSLWGLDRLNAGVNGRPVMLHERDIGLEMKPEPTSCGGAFQIWLQMVGLLDRIIGFYRPSADPAETGWEADFPSFEEIVDAAHGWRLGRGLLVSLEIFYHAIAILSHRSRMSDEGLLSKPSSTRQRLSLLQLVSLLEFHSCEDLVPLPFVPYAFSLALSVAYRQLRQARYTLHRERAIVAMRRCCQILTRLGRVWRTANAVAKIGAQALASLREASFDDGYLAMQPESTGSFNSRDMASVASEASAEKSRTSTVAESAPVLSSQEETSLNGIFSGQIEDIDALFGGILDLNLPSNLNDNFADHLSGYNDIFDDRTNLDQGFI
ncbi:hypothetical protein L228DRAFT_36294 [Xylona heveae TC161]|uniref:Xylanolytic transcriptional activator regulatory domain-containing protein n=1 Tax=Xylona heveae (strain CBS 132557 / TC161) TaxID=1328760 RepID=A0A164ZV10_XYLHT|nr:hypothetical protein L228DRAFT_36294 [Xylona heveae TC161]KZF19568.1 hypothetical protein L228DRAFT_36294 [Xylona heveae TC161]